MINHFPYINKSGVKIESRLPKFIGLLDKFKNSAFAVDTRVLTRDFLFSPIVRIRRSSDDNHCDVRADLSQKVNNNYWISLDSPVQNFSSSSDATTLGEFVGGENQVFPSLAQGSSEFVRGSIFGVLTYPTKESGISDPFGGSNAIRLTWNNEVARFGTSVAGSNGLVPAYTGDVTVSFWGRVSSGSLSVTSTLRSTSTTDINSKAHTFTTSWQRFEHTHSRTEANGETGFYINRSDDAVIEIYGLQMERSSSAGEFEITTTGPSGDGFVRTIFDQSGNSRDAGNATSTDQPKIIDAGDLVDGFTFDGVDDVLGFDPLDVIGEAFSLFFVGDSDIPVIGSGGPALWIGPRRTSNDIREAGLIDGTNQADFNFDAGTYGSGKYTASFYGDSSDSFSARVNGVPSNNNPIAVIGQTSPVNVIRNLMMRTTSDFRSGNVNGYFFFPSELTVDQISAIEANIAEAHP